MQIARSWEDTLGKLLPQVHPALALLPKACYQARSSETAPGTGVPPHTWHGCCPTTQALHCTPRAGAEGTQPSERRHATPGQRAH